MEAFHFKQFSIRHDRSAHKVGTDGVLLGAWTDTKEAKSILDIGCGSGLISLMLAQRTAAGCKIVGVDLHSGSIQDAEYNRFHCPWSNRLEFLHGDVKELSLDYSPDLIVCNPPFFQKSLKAPEESRNLARHTHWTWAEWIDIFASLSESHTRWSLILPVTEANSFMESLQSSDWCIHRQQAVSASAGKVPNRFLLEVSKRKGEAMTLPDLHLYDSHGSQIRSSAYAELTKDFYL